MIENRKGTVSVHGAELYYSTFGRGPACLVLSAIGSEPYKRLTLPYLANFLRLIFVDLRGGGRSTSSPADLTFEVLADDLEAIRGALGAEQVAVLGHSILGLLAIEYARRCPERVSHVIVVGTPTIGDLSIVAAKSSAFFAEFASEERKQLLRNNLAKLPEDASMGETMYAHTPMLFYDPRYDAAPLFADAEFKPDLLKHIIGTLIPDWSIRAALDSLDFPIFIAHGRHDYTVPYVLWEGVVNQLPNATLHLFEKSGHQPFFEEPELFAATLSNWMMDQG